MNVLIFGLGLHGGGVGVANYFLKRGDSVTITDLKTEKELKISLEKLTHTEKLRLTLGKHDYRDIEQSDLIIKNPAVSWDSPFIKYAEKLSKPIDTDIGIFFDIIGSRTNNIVAVTGTRGKSTTTSLIYEILKKRYRNVSLAGNITISVFEIIDSIKKDSWVVLELSSFQLGGIKKKKYSPPYAIITNLYEDHLNYYRDMKSYFEDKKLIYQFQHPGDILVLNRENRVYKMVKPNKGVKFYSFGMKKDFKGYGTYFDETTVYFKDENGVKKIIEKSDIKLKGIHNLLNISASVAMGSALSIDSKLINEAVSNFNGLEHRLEYICSINGVDVYNDSASTTPEALICALESFRGKNITLIMGGTDKKLPLKRLVNKLNSNSEVVNLIFLEGSGTKRLIDEGFARKFQVYNNLEKAVQMALSQSSPGMILLFSPAFASFEMFQNEFDRGKKFKEIINSQL